MAISIKSIPTLKGKEAERFVAKANEASEERGTVDFSRQIKMCAEILKKAKF